MNTGDKDFLEHLENLKADEFMENFQIINILTTKKHTVFCLGFGFLISLLQEQKRYPLQYHS